MSVKASSFGCIKDGREAHLYTITNSKGNSVSVTDFGAIVVSICIADKNGSMQDVVLGYDDAAAYQADTNCFGATIGRNCNRTAGAAFTIDGIRYEMLKNEGENNLHSSMTDGFHKVLWKCIETKDDTCVLQYISPDMENGFPGELKTQVAYTFTEDDRLVIAYTGVSDKKTVFNLTNHSYFNLEGNHGGNVLATRAFINADYYLEASMEKIPTGKLIDVSGTPMDLRTLTAIGDGLAKEYAPLQNAGGYDHCFVIKADEKDENGLCLAASAVAEGTGIAMDVYTDCPGVQFYTCNYDEAVIGKKGCAYGGRTAFCYETSFFPNALHEEAFASPVIEAGKEVKSCTEYRFRIDLT